MGLYLHVDRAGGLEPNEVLELQRIPKNIELFTYSEMFADGFIEHIKNLAEQGLSHHGVQYLVKFLKSETHTPLLFKELYLEYIRWEYGISEPSRFQSLFAWGNYEDALKFARLISKEKQPPIYEVEPYGRTFTGDMILTRANAEKNTALAYWRGYDLAKMPEYGKR